jgi:undecaprenyl-diphosphatase
MEQLLELDKRLFILINSKWNSSVLDGSMPLLRHQNIWGPFYLFMLLFVLLNFKKTSIWWILFAAATAGLTNIISSDFIKENIMRLRPCNDPELAGKLRFLLSYRPQSSSFTSSHAANHFGLAAFFYFTLNKYIGRWAWAFFAWALLVVYAQVYVGVHFPLDVIAGGLVGFLFGYLSANQFNKHYSLL